MVTLNPCSRLETIYIQLLPSILKGAEDDAFLNTRSVIETGLDKLEEQSYLLAQRCSSCGKCGRCEEENIMGLFLDAREKLNETWVGQTSRMMHEVNSKPLMVC